MAPHVARCPVHGPATPVKGRGGAARRTCLCAEQLFVNNNKDSCDGDRAEGRDRFQYSNNNITICHLSLLLQQFRFRMRCISALRFTLLTDFTRTTSLHTSPHTSIIIILYYWTYFPFLPTLLSRLTRVP